MKKKQVAKEVKGEDEGLPEYDFRGGVRGNEEGGLKALFGSSVHLTPL